VTFHELSVDVILGWRFSVPFPPENADLLFMSSKVFVFKNAIELTKMFALEHLYMG